MLGDYAKAERFMLNGFGTASEDDHGFSSPNSMASRRNNVAHGSLRRSPRFQKTAPPRGKIYYFKIEFFS